MNILLSVLATVGRAVIAACVETCKVTLFAAEGLSHVVRPPFYGRLFLRALLDIGYFSLPVVALTAVFTGMVLALQSYTGFARFSAQGATANLVVLSVTRELGPVLAGLMVAGRIGAAMAAELGTMRVTDQIDALTTLSTHPMKYLVAPRLLAGIIALPLLVVVADILGVLGGFIVATAKLGFNVSAYLTNTMNFIQAEDVISGLVKAAVFGFLIALMGCYQGYNSKGGAQGVDHEIAGRGRRPAVAPGAALPALGPGRLAPVEISALGICALFDAHKESLGARASVRGLDIVRRGSCRRRNLVLSLIRGLGSQKVFG